MPRYGGNLVTSITSSRCSPLRQAVAHRRQTHLARARVSVERGCYMHASLLAACNDADREISQRLVKMRRVTRKTWQRIHMAR